MVLGISQETWQFGSRLRDSKNWSDLHSPDQPLLAFQGIFSASIGAIASKHYLQVFLPRCEILLKGEDKCKG